MAESTPDPRNAGTAVDVHVYADPDAATAAAAEVVASLLQDARTAMLPGGNTPLRLYAELARRAIDIGETEFFVLDEYLGVPGAHPRTCSNLIRRSFAGPVGVPAERFHALTTEPATAEAAIRAHEQLIADRGGLDLVILGLGVNGHLGFNEPGSAPDSAGGVVTLTPTSVEANRKWFGGEYAPDRGVTTGLATILAARAVVLLAFGASKAAAVRRMIEDPPGLDSPASWLQRHPGCRVVLDGAAAGS